MDKNIIIIYILLIIIIIKLFKKNKEKFTITTDDEAKIRSIIKVIYSTDLDAIRSLAAMSKRIQENGLTVNGDLNVTGNIKVDGNSTVTGLTTINKLYGGQSTGDGWRDIIVDGGHIRFVVGTNKFGFHENINGLHFYKNNEPTNLPIYPGVEVKNSLRSEFIYTNRLDIKAKNGTTHFNYDNRGETYFRDVIGDPSNLVQTGKIFFLMSSRNGATLQNTYNTAQFNNWNKGSWEQLYIEY